MEFDAAGRRRDNTNKDSDLKTLHCFIYGHSSESETPLTKAADDQSQRECTVQLIDPSLVGFDIQGKRPSRRCDTGSEIHSKVLEEVTQSKVITPARCWSGPGRPIRTVGIPA